MVSEMKGQEIDFDLIGSWCMVAAWASVASTVLGMANYLFVIPPWYFGFLVVITFFSVVWLALRLGKKQVGE